MRVATHMDEDGVLVFDDDEWLLAMLTHLSGQNETAPGEWYLEVALKPLAGGTYPTFADRDAAQD
jgi:hypothetical protein